MNSTAIIRCARSCQSKRSWHQFNQKHGIEVSRCTDRRVPFAVYHLLKKDGYSLNYSEDIWLSLLDACISSCDLKLGRRISKFIESLPSTRLREKSAEIFLLSGEPEEARKISQRSLKLKSISQRFRISFQLIICNSYTEERRYNHAKRVFTKLESVISSKNLSLRDQSELLPRIARSKFNLGEYQDAAVFFDLSYKTNRN